MTTKTTYSFSVSFNGKSNNYRIEPVWDGKQTSVTEYRVVNEFGHTVFVGDAESCSLFVNGSEIKRIAKRTDMKKTDFTIICMLLLFIASNTSEGTWLKTLFWLLTALCSVIYIYQLIKGEDER